MAPAAGVPVTSSLKEIYGEELAVEVAAARFAALTHKFEELYGEGPELVSRAPGTLSDGVTFQSLCPLALCVHWSCACPHAWPLSTIGITRHPAHS